MDNIVLNFRAKVRPSIIENLDILKLSECYKTNILQYINFIYTPRQFTCHTMVAVNEGRYNSQILHKRAF